MPRLHSIRARFTATATTLLLIVLVVVGVSTDVEIRDGIQGDMPLDARPPLLATHRLEYAIAAAALVLLAFGTWMTWWVLGRALRPVAAIRARMSELTVDDLSLRVPVPPGGGEIVLLARTANQTLARLEGAVERHRRFASTTSHELRTPIAGLRIRLEEALSHRGSRSSSTPPATVRRSWPWSTTVPVSRRRTGNGSSSGSSGFPTDSAVTPAAAAWAWRSPGTSPTPTTERSAWRTLRAAPGSPSGCHSRTPSRARAASRTPEACRLWGQSQSRCLNTT
ncbi:MAG: HAMP domain-containing protein [Actinomadura sp.]